MNIESLEIEPVENAIERWTADRTRLGYSARGASKAASSVSSMLGRPFGQLVVVAYDSLRPRPDGIGAKLWWVCCCECGNRRPFKAENLLTSKNPTRSCGECRRELKPWSEFELRQLALAIEWEGSIGVYESERGRSGAYHSPRIVIGMLSSSE